MAATKKEKMQEAQRLGLTYNSKQQPKQNNLTVVNGEVVSREDLDPEPNEARQYRHQFPQSFHD